jgi:hypothetical protein
MRVKPSLFVFAATLLGICTVSAQDPKSTAAVLTGDAKGSAANNPVCKLFTAAEASKYVGKTVGTGENAALGSGCQWAAKDYDGDMLVQIVPASNHEQPTLAKGFQRLPEIGDKAFVLPEMGGWKAATLRGNESIIVSLAGPAASQQATVALLKEVLARRK